MVSDLPARRGAIACGADPANPSSILTYWSAKHPDLPALRDRDSMWTYGVLESRVAHFARAMSDFGVGPGDRIAIVGENELETVAVIFAAWRAGAWAVPLNARYTARELATIVSHADPRLVVVVGAARGRHRDTLGGGASLGESDALDAILRSESERGPVEHVSTETVVLMLYTSGTTGAPKGVMLPARALAFMAGLWAYRPLVAGDRIYQALPISHSYGLCSYLFGALNLGCEVELASRFEPADLHQAFEQGVALFQGVPAMYSRYLDHLRSTGAVHRAPRLKAISTGGAPLDPDLKEQVEAVFGIGLRQAFGMTEAGPTVTIPDDAPQGATALGRPAPGAETRLIDISTGEDAGDGPGELWVRSPGVMRGYFRDDAASKVALTADGWLRTGDLARRAADGVLHIVGRAKDVIIRSGFNVYPAEVEAVLLAHPAVLHAAVIGRPLVDADEDVMAFVELAEGHFVEEGELLAHAAESLAGYKRPSVIDIIDVMPLGLSGKVAYAELKTRLTSSEV